MPDPLHFVFDAGSVNSNGIKTFLAGGLNKFFVKFKQVFNNGSRSLPQNPPDFPVLDKKSWNLSISQ